MYFSVIIPTRNRPDILKGCLQALATQTFPRDQFEILVCDDGSEKDPSKWIQELNLPCSITCHHQPFRGASAARNVAIKKSRGDYVLFLNDDSFACPDLLQKHTEAHAKNKNTSILGFNGYPRKILALPFMALLQKSPLLFRYSEMTSGQFYDFLYFWTCNISLPRAAFEKAGLFDEDFCVLQEDIEMGVRLEKAGYRVFYDASCITDHHHVLTFDHFRRRQRAVGRYAILLAKKHPQITERVTGFPSFDGMENKLKEWLQITKDHCRQAEEFIHRFENKQIDPAESEKMLNQQFKDLHSILLVLNTQCLYEGLLEGLNDLKK